ncbi:MAG TPA: hypothetical protein VJ862_00060 [Rhodanobacteraceae bacterium]|nr:hypothetical protein [Rhodanobacteraceae bacterium]
MNILNKRAGMGAVLLGALLVLGLLPALAAATPTHFNINGTYTGGTFTGSMVVDTTNPGTLLKFDVVFPGNSSLAAFNEIIAAQTQGISNGYTIGSQDGQGDSLRLDFTTTNTAPPFGFGSLAGFDGGTIGGAIVGDGSFLYQLGGGYFRDFSGTITPALTSVPEPAGFGMFGLGVLLIGLFAGLRRRMG